MQRLSNFQQMIDFVQHLEKHQQNEFIWKQYYTQSWVRMADSSSEKVITREYCSCNNLSGELIVTNQGVSFEKLTGFFRSNRMRIHHYTFDELDSLRIERKGFIGGSVALAVDSKSIAWGNRTNRYNMSQRSAERIIGVVRQIRERKSAPQELETLLLRLIKPEGSANLRVVSSIDQVRGLIAKSRGISIGQLHNADSFAAVRNTVTNLIADGRLDGIINDNQEFVSTAFITRKSIEYQVVVDFATILSQLQNRGIVLQSLECPSCKGQLEYPKEGNIITCKFCGATIAAIDVFEKFKTLLS